MPPNYLSSVRISVVDLFEEISMWKLQLALPRALALARSSSSEVGSPRGQIDCR